jgi:plasmid stabilization system protein ParE
MAEVVWTEPAIADLDAVADYIALDNPRAAALLVQRVFRHVEQLSAQPPSGSKLPELRVWRYRQIVELPCRVIYRVERTRVFILHVIRGERLLRRQVPAAREKRIGK